MKECFYITTPIYYVNDKPHIGHFYSTLVADCTARFMRMCGYDVKLCTGTDEHGQKIERSATANQMDVKEFVDKNCRAFQEMCISMQCSNDFFVRTSSNEHKKAVEYLWNTLIEKGHIYLDKYSGWYAARDETFYADSELVDGTAPTGAPVEWIEEESYFFNLSHWQEKLLELYESEQGFIYPNSRKKEVVNFVKSGLRDLSISRTNVKWGIQVPNNPEHTIYVWIDALTSYISALGYPDEQSGMYKKFWCNNSTSSPMHIVGKDILRFHTVYWPAILMAAELPLPKRIFAHGWWQNDGQKISKSLGNAIDHNELVNKFGLDQTRYVFLKGISLGNDGNFSIDVFINTVNADLANNIGNLAQRVLSMIKTYCNYKIPNPSLSIEDNSLIGSFYELFDKIKSLMLASKFDEALKEIQQLATSGNQFIDAQAPWTMRKTDVMRAETVLYIAAELIRCIAIYLLPFIPCSANTLLENVGAKGHGFDNLCFKDRVISNFIVPEPAPLFPRIS